MTVRLLQNYCLGGHRGFAFVEYYSLTEAKKAFHTLSQSTHLLGRRMVLEWAQDPQTVDELRMKTAQKFQLHRNDQAKRIKLEDQFAISTDANDL